jgi:carbon monoxide dehydrogenase subunit G
VTEIALRGVVAQYGRPVIGSVAEKMTREFAACLASMLEREGVGLSSSDAGSTSG